MSLFFIKKEKGKYKFCVQNNYAQFSDNKCLDVVPCEQSLQCVKGKTKNFYVIYSGGPARLIDQLKMAVHDKLTDRESIDYLFLNTELVPVLKKAASKVYSLTNEKDGVWMSAEIFIFSSDVGYSIDNYFFVQEFEESYYDNTALAALSKCKKYTFKSYLDKLMASKEALHLFIEYPLIYGTSDDNFVILKNINGDEKKLNLEEFICQW